MPRPFVGLNLPITAGIGSAPVETARHAEQLGFDFLSINDHPEGNSPSNEAWTLLTWAAAHTTRIRVATRVLGVPYRSPALLAKMAATLGELTSGRLILGLGGGSGDAEMRALGIPVPTPSEKVERLREAATVIRGLWESPAFTFSGDHYRTDDATIEPRPGHAIPLWFGTFGIRALRTTGELADGWIPSLGYVSDDELPRMREIVRDAASAAGRDPDQIQCILNLTVQTQPDDRPGMVSGSPARIIDRLQTLLDAGFHGFNFVLPEETALKDADMLATEVIDHLLTRSLP